MYVYNFSCQRESLGPRQDRYSDAPNLAMPFSVQPVVTADAEGLATTMMSAMYEDPHWVILWEKPALAEITAACAQRLPWNLINGTKHKRHQKVIEIETGQVVGYARWVLPPALADQKAWEEAKVADPSPEDRQLFLDKFNAVTENGRIKGMKADLLAFRGQPLEDADATFTKDGPCLSKLFACRTRYCNTWLIW